MSRSTITFKNYDVEINNGLIVLSKSNFVHFAIKMKFKTTTCTIHDITNLESFLTHDLSKLEYLVVTQLFTKSLDVENCIDTTKFPLFYIQECQALNYGEVNVIKFGFPQSVVLKNFKDLAKETPYLSTIFKYAFSDKKMYVSQMIIQRNNNTAVVVNNTPNVVIQREKTLCRRTYPLYNEQKCIDEFDKFLGSINLFDNIDNNGDNGNIFRTIVIVGENVITTFHDLLFSIIDDDAKRNALKKNFKKSSLIAPYVMMRFGLMSENDINKYVSRKFGFYDTLYQKLHEHIVTSRNKKIQFATTPEDVNNAVVKAHETFETLCRLGPSDNRMKLSDFLLKHCGVLHLKDDDVDRAFVDYLLYTSTGVETLTKWWQMYEFHDELDFLTKSPRDIFDPYINTTTNEFCMKGTTCACDINHTFEISKDVNLNGVVCFWCETPLRRIT